MIQTNIVRNHFGTMRFNFLQATMKGSVTIRSCTYRALNLAPCEP